MLRTHDVLNRLGETRNAKKHPVEKLYNLVDYIAENIEGNENDAARIDEVIFAAKKNIAETILHSQTENKKKHTNEEICSTYKGMSASETNTLMSVFLLSPATCVKNMLEEKLEEKDELDPSVKLTEEEKAYQQQLKENKRKQYERAISLLKGKELGFSAYETARGDIMNDKLNLEGYLQDSFPGSRNPIGDAFETCKPGFFERIFRRTSNEYKNFKAALSSRQNGGASRDDVDNAAKAYLMHKIPGYDGKGLPTEEQMAALTGTSANRAALCYKTLQASQKSRGYEARLDIVQGVAKQNLDNYGLGELYDKMRQDNINIAPALDNQPDKQAAFQKDLANDVNDNNIIKNDNQDLSSNDDLIIKDEEISFEN